MANIDLQSYHASDNFRLARSKHLFELADGTYNLIQLPKFAFVENLILNITQAFTGGSTATITIGFTGNGESADPDGFMDSIFAAPTVVGMKQMLGDTQPGSKGMWFNTASGFVTITIAAGNSSAALRAFVFVQYSVLH